MGGRESYLTRLLTGTNPNCSHTAHQRKGIVANDIPRDLKIKPNRIIRKWPDVPELIRHTENYARRICAVGENASASTFLLIAPPATSVPVVFRNSRRRILS